VLVDVHFVGRVSAEHLARYYRTATLFCAPSTGGESFGIVLLEAMGAGLPVVASDIPGYRSVMRDHLQGRLVPPGDAEALADAIVELLSQPSERARLAQNGRTTAERYDWGLVAPAYSIITLKPWQAQRPLRLLAHLGHSLIERKP
jgi:phosphatidyl-myo-inositol alpha-mannosyltransferase